MVGASLGGIIAGHYGMRHPEQPVVSIDGFAVGTLELATAEDAEEFDAWMTAARAGLEALTAPPETGNRGWMEDQLGARLRFLDQLNDGSAHPEVETRHHFIELPEGVTSAIPLAGCSRTSSHTPARARSTCSWSAPVPC